MRRTLVVASSVVCLLSVPAVAQAKLIEIWGSGLGGVVYGNGETDRDFFKWAGGGAAGVEVGAKIAIFGAYIDYLRFFGGDTGANLISFNLGGDGTLGLTKNLSLVLRLAGSFYLGTLDDKTGPNGEVITDGVNTRGVGVRGGLGLRYTFASVFSIGVTPQLGYHYFFGGADDDITDTDQNSSGWDVNALAYFRVGFGI